MPSLFNRRRPGQLLAAWSAYWGVLALVTLGRPLAAIWRLRRGPEDGGSSASVHFDDGLLRATVVDHGTTVWSGSASFATIAMWVVGPPLLLWLLWLARRPAPAAELAYPPTRLSELGAGGAPADDFAARGRVTERVKREH